MIPIKLQKKKFFFLAYRKMDQDKSYTILWLHTLDNISFGCKDSYNFYDIDVDKILLLKKRDDEYFVRYNDANKNKIVPLQLKINNFSFGE